MIIDTISISLTGRKDADSHQLFLFSILRRRLDMLIWFYWIEGFSHSIPEQKNPPKAASGCCSLSRHSPRLSDFFIRS
jgi:hypothetical protein